MKFQGPRQETVYIVEPTSNLSQRRATMHLGAKTEHGQTLKKAKKGRRRSTIINPSKDPIVAGPPEEIKQGEKF